MRNDVISLNVVHFRNCKLEVSHADAVIATLGNFLCSIIHGIELSDFVGVSYFLEQRFDFFSSSQLSEVMLRNTVFREVRWEQQINCFWFISVVLIKKRIK